MKLPELVLKEKVCSLQVFPFVSSLLPRSFKGQGPKKDLQVFSLRSLRDQVFSHQDIPRRVVSYTSKQLVGHQISIEILSQGLILTIICVFHLFLGLKTSTSIFAEHFFLSKQSLIHKLINSKGTCQRTFTYFLTCATIEQSFWFVKSKA